MTSNSPTTNSSIYVQFELSIEHIQKKLNEELQDKSVIHRDPVFVPVPNMVWLSHKAKITKVDEIQLFIDKKKDILATIPIKLDVVLMQERITRLSPVTTHAEIEIHTRTKVSIDDKGNLKSKTKVIDYQWLSEPKLKVFGFSLNMALLADPTLNRLVVELPMIVDQEIKTEANVKANFAKAYQIIEMPTKVYEKPSIWASFEPTQAFISKLFVDVDEQIIQFSAGLIGYPIIGFNDPTILQVPAPTQPAITILHKQKNSFKINFKQIVDYQTILKTAKDLLVGEKYQWRFWEVEIKDLKVDFENNKLKIITDIVGAINGQISLIGSLLYDKHLSTVYIREFDYELNTTSLMAKWSDWLCHGGFVKQIQKKLQFSLTNYVELVKESVITWLAQQPLDKGIHLNFNMEKVVPQYIDLTKQGLSLHVLATGTTNVLAKKY